MTYPASGTAYMERRRPCVPKGRRGQPERARRAYGETRQRACVRRYEGLTEEEDDE